MTKKLKDSKKEEKVFRKERNKVRKELELMLGVSSNKYKRIIERLKQLVDGKKCKIRKKNKTKLTKYKKEQEERLELKKLSSLPEECCGS